MKTKKKIVGSSSTVPGVYSFVRNHLKKRFNNRISIFSIVFHNFSSSRKAEPRVYRRTISISILGTHPRVSIQRQYHWLAQSFLNYYISPPRISFSEASRPEIFWFPCVCLAGYNFHLNCPPIHPNRKGPGVYLVCVITYWWESITRPATLAA